MTKKASKLLEQMERSKAKWKVKDLLALYEGHGFVVKSGGKHYKVWHPDYPMLYAFLPRTKLGKPYVSEAVKLVNHLKRLEGSGEDNDQVSEQSKGTGS